MNKTILLITLISFIGLKVKAQKENFKQVDEIKTTESKENIDHYLAGYWQFVEMKSPQGLTIDTLFHPSGDLNFGYEIITRTDYYFNADGTFASNDIISSTTPINVDSTIGTWLYSETEKELMLTYYEPKYILPEGIDPAYAQTLKDQMAIKPIEGKFMEIHFISQNELIIIEHQAHSENELIYNLIYYRKRK